MMWRRVFAQCRVKPMQQRALVLALSAVSTLGLAASAEAATSVNLTYKLYAGGLHLATLIAVPAVSENRYQFAVAARSEGLVSYLFDWRLKGFAEGRRQADAGVPERYETQSGDKGDQRTVQVKFDDGKPKEVHAVPPYRTDSVTAVPDRLLNNTVDPLTATLHTFMLQEPKQACRAEVAVYDGRRRYDLQTRNSVTKVLKRNRFNVFSGPTERCDLIFKRIAGFKKKHRPDAQTGPTRVWVAQMPTAAGNLTVPVKLQSESRWGTLIAHLDKVD